MNEKEKYLKSLKKELDLYTKELSKIQKEFKGKTGKNVEKINQSLQNILEEAGTAYGKLQSASAAEWEPVKAITTEAFGNLRTSFQETLNTSVQRIQEYAENVEENCQEQLEQVAKYVRKHPFKSIFLAVGAGFIIGKILK